MKKILVETTSAIMLMTRFGFIQAFRPSITKTCAETSQFVADQLIEVSPLEVHPDATDEGFAEFYAAHDKDTETALENYNLSLAGVVEIKDDDTEAEAKAKAEAEAQAQAEAEAKAKAEAEAKATTAKTTTAKAKTPAAKS